MKTLIGAIALAIAVPAVAQTAPATDPHAGHAKHDMMKHDMTKHDCKECCEKMKDKDGKMECMEQKGEADADKSGHAGHEGHSGH